VMAVTLENRKVVSIASSEANDQAMVAERYTPAKVDMILEPLSGERDRHCRGTLWIFGFPCTSATGAGVKLRTETIYPQSFRHDSLGGGNHGVKS
jgi:hypothetical protein